MEEFQILKFEGIKNLLAIIVMVGCHIYDIGTSAEDGFIRLLGYIGGWNGSGKIGKYLIAEGFSLWMNGFKVNCFIKTLTEEEKRIMEEGTWKYMGIRVKLTK
ncbi:MAG: hypothetical protein AB1630_12090 [bacterium]